MKPHKWAKEIKAWADGAEIEQRYVGSATSTYQIYIDWHTTNDLHWDNPSWEYRIKPPQSKSEDVLSILQWLVNHRGYGDLNQWTLDVIIENFMEDFDCKVESIKLDTQPKEPQYLYVYKEPKSDTIGVKPQVFITTEKGLYFGAEPIGKIKLEQDDVDSV